MLCYSKHYSFKNRKLKTDSKKRRFLYFYNMARKTKDPGLGYNSKENAQSVIKDDGSSNVNHINRKRNVNDLYSFFVDISWVHFFLLIILTYTLLNVFFGLIYVAIGIEEITKPKETFFADFLNGFFFSAQTLTTVGYGGIVPKGIASNLVAAFEAMIGLLSFSFITGLLYGRFSKPKASLFRVTCVHTRSCAGSSTHKRPWVSVYTKHKTRKRTRDACTDAPAPAPAHALAYMRVAHAHAHVHAHAHIQTQTHPKMFAHSELC